jgi:photosystem II stability/assembly factor-like uncharacterized protein
MSRSFVLVGALAVLVAAPVAAGRDRWTSLGPEGGSIARLSPSPAAPGTVWAVSEMGRIFTTRDGAITWAPVPQPRDTVVLEVVPDPSDAAVVYARTQYDILKTTDGGATWGYADTGSTWITDLAIAPSQPSVLYAVGADPVLPSGISYRLLKSTDSGSRWHTVAEMAPSNLTVSPKDPETLLASFSNRVLRSGDGGMHWEPFGAGSQISWILAWDPRDPETLYGTDKDGLLQSSDGGATWTPLVTNGFVVYRLNLDPAAPGALWGIGYSLAPRDESHLWKSEDRGEHWTRVVTPDVVRDVAFDPRAGVLAGVDRLGVLQSSDGGLHWTSAHRGLRALVVTELAVTAEGTVLAGARKESPGYTGGNNLLLRSRDGGASWEDALQRVDLSAIGLSSSAIHLSGSQGGPWRSMDDGATWSSQHDWIPFQTILLDIAPAPSRPRIVYTTGIVFLGPCGPTRCGEDWVFKSADGGLTWLPVYPLPEGQSGATILVHPQHPGTVWVGGKGLLRSTDGGAHWVSLGSGLRGPVRDLAIDPSAPDTLYAAVQTTGNRKVFKSRNGGVTWKPAASGLPAGMTVRELTVDSARPATLYAVTDAGVFISEDRAAHWRHLGEGLEGRIPLTVAVDPSDPRTIYAGTDAGLFVLTRTDR